MRLLIVEDNSQDAELLIRELHRAGYKPEWTRVDTEDEYLKHLSPDLDLILSDYEMPGFSGPRALELLQEKALHIPFIIVSGTIGEEQAVEAMKMGATDYLLKDRLGRLGAAVALAMENFRLQRERLETHAELRRMHEEVHRLLEHSPAVIYTLRIVGERGEPQRISENIIRMTGYTAEEACNCEWWIDHLHPDDRQQTLAGFRCLLESGTFTNEYRLRHRDGHYFWLQDHQCLVRDDEGAPVEIAGAWTDITERKLTSERLRDSSERFRQLAENIQEVFWITDVAKTQMLYISPAYEKIWGRSCASLYASPMTWLEAIHPEDRDAVKHAADLEQVSGNYDLDYRIVRPDGSIRWIRDRAFPVRHEDTGEIYRVAGVAEDISERKGAAERLRQQAELLDKARDAIMVADLDYRITYWNKSAEILYGWKAEEVIGRNGGELFCVVPEMLENTSKAVHQDGQWTGEVTHRTKAGLKVLIESRCTSVRDASGMPQSILAINTDITEKRRLEQQFLRSQRMENIGALAGGIAHDLNNVLAPIMMSIDLLRLTNRDERTVGVLNTIETSARRGADMVHQILSFARGVDSKRDQLDPRTVIADIQNLVRETFPKNIEFHCNISGDVPLIIADCTQVHQVLLNLCVNARDAMPDGGLLSISAENLAVDEAYAAMHGEAKPGMYFAIAVSDTGTGMPPEVIEKIFDPFFTTKEIGKGTGLGLSTVHGIVKGHGGFLCVESKPGNGTTFTICLPATLPLDKGQAAAAVADLLPRGQGERILLVEDEAAVRAITRETLEAFGYKVQVASDGADAVAKYATDEHRIAVVMMDMMMPVMDGPTTIQVLKRLNPEVCIIGVSGLGADDAAAKASSMGVKHFLNKPYTAGAILTTLRRVIDQNNAKQPT